MLGLKNIKPWRIAHSEASLGWGGQERRILAELTGFKSRNAWIAALAPPESTLYSKSNEAAIPVCPLNVHRLRLPFEVIRQVQWLKRNRIQILNTHSSRDGYLLGMSARMAGVPLLIRSRHIDVSYPNPYISRYAFTSFADHILTTSQKISKKLIETFDLNPNCVTTVPTGIDLERYKPDGVIADLGIGQKIRNHPPATVGMISVLRSWKGHPIFIKAIKMVRKAGIDLQAFIVGDGPQKENIEDLVNSTGQNEEIKLLGYREDIPELLRSLDILVIPSTAHEGIPQIGLQALACGAAVIGSNVGGIPEIIIPGKTGRIVEGNDSEALAQCIIETITDKGTTDRFIEAGKLMVSRSHSRQSMLDKLHDIYVQRLGNQWKKDGNKAF